MWCVCSKHLKRLEIDENEGKMQKMNIGLFTMMLFMDSLFCSTIGAEITFKMMARLCYKNKEIWKDANWNKITVSKHGKIKKGKQPTLDTIPGKYIRILTIFVRQFLFWIWNSVKMPQNKIFNIIFYIMSFRLVDFFCIFLYWCQIEIH